MLSWSVIDRGLELQSDYIIGICGFSAKHVALRTKSYEWLARNQDNMSDWDCMSIRRLLFQSASTMKIQLSVLVEYKADLIIISLKINLLSSWYRWKVADLALNNNHSITPCEWGWKTDSAYTNSLIFTSTRHTFINKYLKLYEKNL